ncbi:hypothetical protein LCGC14_1335570 [marine sediment metagenome]|uniref:Major facilitator superfamily (MFS) profile domain-containing protein n=1 Tax=marine sediment metagenome TaxID=412755 RepID=A0A0F9NHR1_9ZZZZ
MVLERRMKPKNFRLLGYSIGIALEIVGFGLFFAFDETMTKIQAYPIIFSVALIFAGYILAISVRRFR